MLELNGNIREQPENFAIFAQILNQPQNSLILVKGRAVICTYYCSIGKLLGQSERTLYVPVTVCSTNKQLIETIENMLNGACQSSSFEDSSQSHDVPTIEEVHTCIRQLILNYSPNNDFVNVCSIGSDLQRKFQSIKTFWAMNNVSGLPEFAKKCSNLYQIQIKQGKGTCTIIEIRNVDSSSKDLNIANRTSKLESFKDTSGSQYVPTIDEVHKCIRQLILNYSQNNDFVNVCSIGSDLQRKFQSIKTFWAMNNVSGLPEFAYKYDHLYQIQTRQGKGTCKIIEIRNANSFIVNSGIDDLKVNQNNLSKIADSISDIEKKEFFYFTNRCGAFTVYFALQTWTTLFSLN